MSIPLRQFETGRVVYSQPMPTGERENDDFVGRPIEHRAEAAQATRKIAVSASVIRRRTPSHAAIEASRTNGINTCDRRVAPRATPRR